MAPGNPQTASSPLAGEFHAVRVATEVICSGLRIEDYGLQGMEEASPPKWHLAHTSWFFEQFVLEPFYPGYRVFGRDFHRLFNSYYETVGIFHQRSRRGDLSRPLVEEVYDYRDYVDEHVMALLSHPPNEDLFLLVRLGLQHEQQHQELLFTDIKYNFSRNPLFPSYRSIAPMSKKSGAAPIRWHSIQSGVYAVGAKGDDFSFDNERPRHRVYVGDVALAHRPITNGEFLEFVESEGYDDVRLWLQEGWVRHKKEGWNAPLYWHRRADGRWCEFTFEGMRELRLDAPVTHVNYFEADAFARWYGARLPLESEWEVFAESFPVKGNFADSLFWCPIPSGHEQHPTQFFGDVWEWTSSAYSPYPGFCPLPGSLGEYNGKFMCNQYVLRGGSCVTPPRHVRASYRNFFSPDARWQFSGIRLAKDI